LHIPKQSSNHEFFNTTTSNDELVILLVPGEKELVVNDHLFMYIALLFFLKDLDSFVQFLLIRRRESLQVRVLGRPELLTDYSRKKKDQQGSRDAWPLQKPTI
jgi:hypothetical protein